VRAGDRATEFHQRCVGLGIQGVSLHSYRYAWAERARKCGFPMRFAQEALGHNSKAIHAAYASKAEVKVPSLDAWEKGMKDKVVEFKPALETPREQPTAQAPAAAVS
jgi:integrase